MSKLTPPDPKQCQAEKPNGHSFMTLGGRPGRERCTSKPVVIAKENKPGSDGKRGSMSLCSGCLAQLRKQLGQDYVSIKTCMEFDITSDGKTVWINGVNGCISRFGEGGIDIHTEAGDTECLFCTHGPTTLGDWDLFVEKMQFFYGIKVLQKFKPLRLRERAASAR